MTLSRIRSMQHGVGESLKPQQVGAEALLLSAASHKDLLFFFLFFFKVIIIVVCLFYYLMKWKSKPSTIIITQQLLSFSPFCWTLFIFSHSVNWVFIFWVWFTITVNAHVPFTRVHNHSSKMIYQKKKKFVLFPKICVIFGDMFGRGMYFVIGNILLIILLWQITNCYYHQ